MIERHATKPMQRVNLRLTDTAVTLLLDDLFKSERLGNKTEILNEALKIGVSELHTMLFGRNASQDVTKTQKEKGGHGNDQNYISKDLAALKIMSNQNAVILKICEKLLTVLYNLERAKAEEKETLSDLFSTGALEQLPEAMENAKIAMIRSELIAKRGKNYANKTNTKSYI
jgi:hypothetical protein